MLTGTLASGVGYAFTDRHGGVSPAPYNSCNLGTASGDTRDNVQANRAAVADELGVDDLVFLHQVHGADVVVSDGPWLGLAPQADGAVTAIRGLGLGVLVADCTPLLLADPEAAVIAAVHVGRSGLAKGIAHAAVTRMRGLGAHPERIIAVAGPAVCGACYEVPAALQAEVAAVAPAARSRTRSGTPSLDIPAGVAAQLRDTGVLTVTRIAACTMESPDLFSYRRDGVTGRFAGIVFLEA